MPAGARGHYKIQCNARWHELKFFLRTTVSIFFFFFQNDQKNELDSDLYVKICGYHFYMYICLIILFSTENVKHSYLR